MSIEDYLYPLLSRYMAAPDWLKRSIGHAYAGLPRRVRMGTQYDRFHAELNAAHDAAAARSLARSKLAATLRCALDTVPAYAPYRPLLQRDLDPEELLAELPLVDKTRIKADTERYVSHALPRSQRLETHTGGSTRIPLRFYLQKHVTRPREYAYIDDFRRRAGWTGRALSLALRGRPVPGSERPGGRTWTLEPIKNQIILSSAHMQEEHMEAHARALARLRPRYIEAYPSLLHPLARWLAAHPLPEFTAQVRGVLLYSEMVQPSQVELLRSVFDCPVLKHYGHSERVLMAASMPDDERYFFWPQYGWLELVDREGRPITRPGVLGQIVGTSFDNEVMPFVRYCTGDLAVLSASGHPQLPAHTACETIEGRLQEFLVGRDGQLISMTAVGAEHSPYLHLFDALQYLQERPGELVVTYVAGGAPAQAALDSIAERVAARSRCHVRVERVQDIERTANGKQLMLLQKLDVSRHVGAGAAA